jgi:hypothetical protein
MQHLEGSGTAVLYLGRKVPKRLNIGTSLIISHLLSRVLKQRVLSIGSAENHFEIYEIITKPITKYQHLLPTEISRSLFKYFSRINVKGLASTSYK